MDGQTCLYVSISTFRGFELCHRLNNETNFSFCVDVIFASLCVYVCLRAWPCLFDSQLNTRWIHICTLLRLRIGCPLASSPRPPV